MSSPQAIAVQAKHLDLARSYQSRRQQVEAVQHRAIHDVLPDIVQELDLQQEGRNRALAYLEDTGTVFRFYRRSRYDADATLALLSATLLWRLRTDLDQLSLSSLHPLYVSPPTHPPLFWLNSRFTDRFGRPCGLISLRSLERTGDQTLEEIKEYIVFSMELARRLLADWFAQKTAQGAGAGAGIDLDDESEEGARRLTDATPPLQMTIAFDLARSGMANLELELLPFLLDLLKNHFPGMVGAVYMLHYGWVHAGMWTIAKRVLPQQALARIFFPKDQELLEHFPAENLPTSLSRDGELDVEIDAKHADVARKYGRRRRANTREARSPADSPMMERNKPLSRTASFESIYEVFYSADATPWASRPLTPRESQPGTPRGDDSPRRGSTPSGAGGLHMTPSAARKLRDLQMTRGVHSSDLSATAEARDYYHARRRANSGASGAAPFASAPSQDPFALGNGGLTPQARMSPATTPRYGRSPSLGFAQLHSVTTPSADVVPTGASLGRPGAPPPRLREVERERSRSTSPSRIGTMRDFRLHLPPAPRDAADAVARVVIDGATSESGSEAGDEYGSAGGEEDAGSSEGEGSETSGKAGEKRISPAGGAREEEQEAGAGMSSSGFFSRWARGVTSPTTPTAGSARPKATLRRESTEDEKAYRARMREQQSVQSQAMARVASAGSASGQSEAAATKAPRRPSVGPTSPRLQVPLLDEPPIAPLPSSAASGLTGPMRYLSQRSRKYANQPGVVSPYNATNPFYGYPAVVSTHPSHPGSSAAPRSASPRSATASAFPHHLHARRRKRDLVRTLAYLFVLRILAAHRQVRWQASLAWRETQRALHLRDPADTEERDAWRAAEERHRRRRKSAVAGFGAPSSAERERGWGRQAALLVLLLLLLRGKWRERVRDLVVGSGAGALALLGAAEQGEGEMGASLSGLHVRRRLGMA